MYIRLAARPKCSSSPTATKHLSCLKSNIDTNKISFDAHLYTVPNSDFAVAPAQLTIHAGYQSMPNMIH
jgi:hypothetical protein